MPNTAKRQVKKIVIAMTNFGLTEPQINQLVLITFELANGNLFRESLLKLKPENARPQAGKISAP